MPAKTKKKSVKKPERIPETVPEISPSPPSPQEVPQIPIETPLTIEKTVLAEEEVPLERKNKILYLLGIVFLVLTVLLSTGIFFAYKNESNKKTLLPSTTPMQTLPTPVPFKTADYTLEILNGSGVAGTAAKAADQIKNIGFQVISVGNADKSNYKDVQIYTSSSADPFKDQILTSIKAVYEDARLSGELKDSTFSARIIIGK